jgi:3,4-dihydroxy-2-butanone 4-phosphate synthase
MTVTQTITATTNGHADFRFDDMDGALSAFKAGEFLVVMDDEGRENEGDLIIAASKVTTKQMAWMIKHTRCLHHPYTIEHFTD